MPCIFLRTVPQAKQAGCSGLLTQLTACLEVSGVYVSTSTQQADLILTLRCASVLPPFASARRPSPPPCFADALRPFSNAPICPQLCCRPNPAAPHIELALDAQQGAQWLSRNETALARALASGVLCFFSLPIRSQLPPRPAQARRSFALLSRPMADAKPLCTVPQGTYGSVLNAHRDYLIVRFRETVGFAPSDDVQLL